MYFSFARRFSWLQSRKERLNKSNTRSVVVVVTGQSCQRVRRGAHRRARILSRPLATS